MSSEALQQALLALFVILVGLPAIVEAGLYGSVPQGMMAELSVVTRHRQISRLMWTSAAVLTVITTDVLAGVVGLFHPLIPQAVAQILRAVVFVVALWMAGYVLLTFLRAWQRQMRRDQLRL